MPFGKTSQQPVPRPFMVKKHSGMGNHKQVIKTNSGVRANGGLKQAGTGQPGKKA